jgi:nitrile hydratase subunit beta
MAVGSLVVCPLGAWHHRGSCAFMPDVDGIHDLGGMQGFGPVEIEVDEPVFHQRWEGRVFAMAGAISLQGFNTPTFRHSIERMDPAHYLSSSYYEHWLTGVTTLLVKAGIVSAAELTSRAGSPALSRPALVGTRDIDTTPGADRPAFTVGDAVRVADVHFGGHTRCPRYVRGHHGVIVRVDDAFPVPEIEAHRNEKVLEHTYGVRFDATELWGDSDQRDTAVYVDLHERYLRRA